MQNKNENFAGNAALIMLFFLSLSLSSIEQVQDSEADAQESR